jgi:hypothetical protein
LWPRSFQKKCLSGGLKLIGVQKVRTAIRMAFKFAAKVATVPFKYLNEQLGAVTLGLFGVSVFAATGALGSLCAGLLAADNNNNTLPLVCGAPFALSCAGTVWAAVEMVGSAIHHREQRRRQSRSTLTV